MACLLNTTQCLFYAIPWWAWPALGLIIVGIILRLFGWRWALTVGAAVGAAALLARARQQGYQDRKEIEKKAQDRSLNDFKKTETKIDEKPISEVDKENQKWLRK